MKYDDVPKVMVDAVISIEDRRFFQHSGVNYARLIKSVWVDVREGYRGQGGSTITMQVARLFFLSPEKKIKRKMIEMLISMELEQRFSNASTPRLRHHEQVFEIETAAREEGGEVVEEKRKAQRPVVLDRHHALDHRPLPEKLVAKLRLGPDHQVGELLVLRQRANQREDLRHILRPRGLNCTQTT